MKHCISAHQCLSQAGSIEQICRKRFSPDFPELRFVAGATHEGTDLIPTVDQQTRDNSTEYSGCTSDEDLHFYSRTKCYSSRP